MARQGLTFTWDRASSIPNETLRAANLSAESYVVYKVKTTAPKRYVVRPPQGFVRPGQEASIKVTMVKEDAADLWKNGRQSDGDVNSEDKFLVQTALVNQEFFVNELSGGDEKQVGAVLAELFKKLGADDKKGDGPKKIKSVKLTTKFAFSVDMAASEEGPRAASVPASALAASASPTGAASTMAPAPAAPAAASSRFAGEGGASELAALRQKHDDLVSSTVGLTAERDALQQENTKLKGALSKAELSLVAAKSAGAASGGGSGGGGGAVVTKEAAGGFGLGQVLVVALAAFLAGKLFM